MTIRSTPYILSDQWLAATGRYYKKLYKRQKLGSERFCKIQWRGWSYVIPLHLNPCNLYFQSIAIINIQITEQPSLYDDPEKKSVREILEDINWEDQKVALAMQEAIPQTEQLASQAVPHMKQGERIFYVDADTSECLRVLNASEIPPTLGMLPTWVIGLIAGRDAVLHNPMEGAEDNVSRRQKGLTKYHINRKDTVIGIAASGATPCVIGALRKARRYDVLTDCITSSPNSPVAAGADVATEMIIGPEYVTGNSRMKSGTGQRMILGVISTSMMIQLERVEGNKMVSIQFSNYKLVERGTRMTVEEPRLDHGHAQKLLLLHGSVEKTTDAYRYSQGH